MQYFKNAENKVYAFEDEDKQELIPSDLISITETEAMSIVNPPLSDAQRAELWEGERSRLRQVADDEIAWRQDAVDSGVATPEVVEALAVWRKYRALLMMASSLGEFPPEPDYVA